MEKVEYFFLEVHPKFRMKVNGIMESSMVKVHSYGLMDLNMMDNLFMVKNKVQVYLLLLMVIIMMDTGLQENKKVREQYLIKMDNK